MRTNFSLFLQISGVIFALLGVAAIPVGAMSEEKTGIPAEDQPKVLLSEIEAYVASSRDPEEFKARILGDVRVAYLGFSPEEIAMNASMFPDIAEHDVEHLPYGRTDYYSVPVDLTDYQTPNTITVLNVDLTRDVVPGSGVFKKGTDLTKVLAPDGNFFHALGKSIFELMKVQTGGGAVIEFGPPMERFRDTEFSFRDAVLDTACTSVFEYVEYDDGSLHSFMVLYSEAVPGSQDQLQCMKMQALVFMRPASQPFSTMLDGK
jgi:hypothetical protein